MKLGISRYFLKLAYASGVDRPGVGGREHCIIGGHVAVAGRQAAILVDFNDVVIGRIAAQVARGKIGIGVFDEVVHSPVQSVDVKIYEYPVPAQVAHGQLRLGVPLVLNIYAAVALGAFGMEPSVVVARPQD